MLAWKNLPCYFGGGWHILRTKFLGHPAGIPETTLGRT